MRALALHGRPLPDQQGSLLAATSKCLAKSNKSDPGGKATKEQMRQPMGIHGLDAP
jgi:hypothetical protein